MLEAAGFTVEGDRGAVVLEAKEFLAPTKARNLLRGMRLHGANRILDTHVDESQVRLTVEITGREFGGVVVYTFVGDGHATRVAAEIESVGGARGLLQGLRERDAARLIRRVTEQLERHLRRAFDRE